jgi:hypothetical protein
MREQDGKPLIHVDDGLGQNPRQLVLLEAEAEAAVAEPLEVNKPRSHDRMD